MTNKTTITEGNMTTLIDSLRVKGARMPMLTAANEIERLQADNARLRAALEEIADYELCHDTKTVVQGIAERALANEQTIDK